MSIFDELRDALLDVGDQWILGGYIDTGDIRDCLDTFEAAHPGLIDKTVNCANCGQPTMDSGDGFTICPACAKEAE